MGKLMVIAVSVDDGATQALVDKNGCITLDPNAPSRVVAVDSAVFDEWVCEQKGLKNIELPSVHNNYEHLYSDGNLPNHVGVILFTHHSPGQACVIFHGVPICVP